MEKQTDFHSYEKFTVPLKNAAIESLQDFIDNHLLRQSLRWKNLLKKEDDRIYLAVTATVREGPTNLPMSANEIRTIKELIDQYFPNKDRMMHVILDRKDSRVTTYEDDNALPNFPSLQTVKKESYDKSKSSIKQEHIKQERKPIKLKFKRPPSDSYETPTSTRVKDLSPVRAEKDSPLRFSCSPLSSPDSTISVFIRTDKLISGEESSYRGQNRTGNEIEDGDIDDGIKDTPLACRTRGKTAGAGGKGKGKARA
ncbi:hypothetical protein EPUS_05340 [Endocarpon pusillum Z07020]|uniref:Uncharacterized protein n=1 Tax=Endocarpon pusillum (strain Z07020 / HMAS-L-300199) TaxID=1263415 RepID=U1G8X1_ENDPU|nr:uncharacterized protein EPUS_05340 [Endocarpon pusillum Z07020]ERF73917.1 hypothetical protein EPUS_05340 [Endocarpon pusillum Z07020]